MALCLVAVGANIGDRRGTLSQAVAQLTATPHIVVRATSTWHDTQAIGGPFDQPAYLNGAVLLETSLAPTTVLSVLERVEASLGRVREMRWGPRTVDLDLLLYDDLVLALPDLTVPHPRMAFRRFVIDPAAEIAADLRHPTIGWTMAQLRDHLRYAVPYVAIAGASATARGRLAADLAARGGARLITDQDPGQSTAAAGSDSAGPACARAIELLDLRRRLLDREQWADPSRLAVSDFWLEQPLVDSWLSADAQSEQGIAMALPAARATALRPKLLVLLDSHADEADRSLAARAQRPGVGPLLHLTDESPAEILAQAVAAIEAMT